MVATGPSDAQAEKVSRSEKIVEFETRERQRQATAPEQRGCEPLSTKGGQLLDDAGFGAVRQVETAVHAGIVVAAIALEDAREPER
jgi:hypothetical protein